MAGFNACKIRNPNTLRTFCLFLQGFEDNYLHHFPAFGMKTLISRLFAALLLLSCASIGSRAQSTMPITGRSYWGFDLGLTGSAYEGNQNFLWHLYDPTAVDPITLNPQNDVNAYLPFNTLGSGLGFLLGFKAAVPLTDALDLEGKLRYVSNYTSNTESQQVVLAWDRATNQVTDQSNATSRYSLFLSNISLAALLNLRLSEQFYGIGGLEFSSLLSNAFAAHQDLTTTGKSYYYSNTPDQSGATLIDHANQSSSNTFNPSRVALQIGAGTVFDVGKSSLLDAELLFSIPFTSWLTSSGETDLNNTAAGYLQPAITFPRLWYASLTIGIRFPFSSPEAAPVAYESNEVPGKSQGIGPDGKVALTGTVTDAKTGQPVDATMTVVDLTNNQVVATDRTHDGKYNVRVKAPGKYSVTADADGYLFGTAYFQVDDQGRILARDQDIKLSETKGGRTRLLVFFDFNSATLKPSSYPELNRAVHLMKAVPNMKVQIAGYTDSVGTDQYNRQLSQRRAEAVRDYIVQNGIAANRVTAHGYGKESPIADNGTEAGRAENRRVEFVVLSD